MPRPRTITNEEILDAARELFLERGATVTTAEIATHAGISEGTIFKRFPTKNALLMAAMGLEQREDPKAHLAGLLGRGSMKQNLARIATQMMKFYRQLIPRVMVLCSRDGMDPRNQPLLHGKDSPHRHAHQALAAHLQLEMDGGRLGQGDPELMARVLSASVWNFVFFENLGHGVYSPVEGDQYIAGLVDMLWAGLAPQEVSS